MIIIHPLDGTPAEHFEDYNELFECILVNENLKRAAKHPDFKNMDWSFTVFPPIQAAALYALSQDPCPAITEAFEDNLPLIEIYTGDYQKPLYIVDTPNVDMDYLKKKWCVDWCTFHNLVVREV
jgi:hypothetical protein